MALVRWRLRASIRRITVVIKPIPWRSAPDVLTSLPPRDNALLRHPPGLALQGSLELLGRILRFVSMSSGFLLPLSPSRNAADSRLAHCNSFSDQEITIRIALLLPRSVSAWPLWRHPSLRRPGRRCSPPRHHPQLVRPPLWQLHWPMPSEPESAPVSSAISRRCVLRASVAAFSVGLTMAEAFGLDSFLHASASLPLLCLPASS